jgi:hypothetical protein
MTMWGEEGREGGREGFDISQIVARYVDVAG